MRVLPAAFRLVAAIGLCAGLNFLAPHAAARTDGLPGPFDPSAIDRHADACSDFFAYATGAYRASHPIPPEYGEYGYSEQLEDRTRDIVRNIIVRARSGAAAPGSDQQKIGTFFGTCMDTAAIERADLNPIAPELKNIAAIANRTELLTELGRLHALGVDAGFAFNPAPDTRDSTKMLGEIDQGGMGLPERDYYVRSDAGSRRLRAQYAGYIAALLRSSGERAAGDDARAIVRLETRFARAATPLAALREPEVSYHPMSVAALVALAPHAALRQYLRSFTVASSRINVAEPEFVRVFDRTLVSVPLTTWKSYLRWRLLDTFAATLPARFGAESFAFHGRILNGVRAEPPRWKRCVNATNAMLGEAVGRAYVASAFSARAKAAALELTLRIKRAYRAELQSLSWLAPATKRIASAKLDAMDLKVGYPTVWRSYAGYAVGNDSYFANVARGEAFARRYELAKIGRPVDRAEWDMTPQTVNAYNDVERNEIVVPAAQLQRPFYDPDADDAANLGATGAGTLGHEMTHGFDEAGRKYDAGGNLKNWWTPGDVRAFDARSRCLVARFDRTVAVGSVHYAGEVVADEAIADLGGVTIGYRALEAVPARSPRARRDGFTREQRYFLAYAQSWSESVRPETARTQALSDSHPLPRDRVNVTLANVPAWYAAFGCTLPATPVCKIW